MLKVLPTANYQEEQNESLSHLIEEIGCHVNEIIEKNKSYEAMHLGLTNLNVGKVLNLIKNTPGIFPPRTGHLGNWKAIVEGRAGVMDFNKSIIQNYYGYPLIYCFNQTEDDSLTKGDWVYLPGSVVSNTNKKALDLYTWNGTRFVKRTREAPLFTPFTFTLVDGDYVPLVKIHKEIMDQLPDFNYQLETSVVYKNKANFIKYLTTLLNKAKVAKNSQRELQDLLSHQVSLDGSMSRTKLDFKDDHFVMGDMRYSSAEQLAKAAFLPIYAVEDPESFVEDIDQIPFKMPLISNTLSGVFSAVFGSHLTQDHTDNEIVNVHFHWGARDMAGYPPYKKGYFMEKSTKKSYRKIMNILKEEESVKPSCFVILPSIIFALWPSDQYPNDIYLVSSLLKDVASINESSYKDQNLMMTDIEEIVKKWLATNEAELSDYFLNKFRGKKGIHAEKSIPSSSTPIEPKGFGDLSFKQACMIIGALYKENT